MITVKDKLLEIIRNRITVPVKYEHHTLLSLGLDSLDVLELTDEIEKEFHIKITLEDVSEIFDMKIPELIEFIDKLVNN